MGLEMLVSINKFVRKVKKTAFIKWNKLGEFEENKKVSLNSTQLAEQLLLGSYSGVFNFFVLFFIV